MIGACVYVDNTRHSIHLSTRMQAVTDQAELMMISPSHNPRVSSVRYGDVDFTIVISGGGVVPLSSCVIPISGPIIPISWVAMLVSPVVISLACIRNVIFPWSS